MGVKSLAQALGTMTSVTTKIWLFCSRAQCNRLDHCCFLHINPIITKAKLQTSFFFFEKTNKIKMFLIHCLLPFFRCSQVYCTSYIHLQVTLASKSAFIHRHVMPMPSNTFVIIKACLEYYLLICQYFFCLLLLNIYFYKREGCGKRTFYGDGL